MMTHNEIIFHCLECGAVAHGTMDSEDHNCCGRPMVSAAATTVADAEPKEALTIPASRNDRPIPRVIPK